MAKYTKRRDKRAVSYTHLDVYKRQGLCRQTAVKEPVEAVWEWCAASSDLSCQLRQGGTSLLFLAVSYTHLDVYKRQLFLAGAGSVVSKQGRSACGAKRSPYPAAME